MNFALVPDAVADLIAKSGALWFVAAAAVLIASTAEAAKPSDATAERGVLGLISGLNAFISPFLLLLHAFWAVAPHGAPAGGESVIVSAVRLMPPETLAALGLAIVTLLVGPSPLGWLIGRVSRALAGVIFAASPVLNAAALVFTAYVTYANVGAVLTAAFG